jgi:hypothetical protein
MITLGILNANIIRAGILQSKDGSNKWDLDNGLFAMQNGKISIQGTVTKYASEYTQDDVDRANDITIGLVIPTVEDYEKLDLNGDGVIDIFDVIVIEKLLNGSLESYEIPTNIEINPLQSQSLLKTDGVSIGIKGAYFEHSNSLNAYMQNVYVMGENTGFHKGASGMNQFTTTDGKTITVLNGIIINIS